MALGGVWLRGICYVLLFLVCVLVFARVRSRRLRITALLIASLLLYLTWTPWFLAVLIFSTFVNFLHGKWVRRDPSKLPLWAGIAFNVALLAVFKYLPELSSHLPINAAHTFSRIALPLGISFWTFQALSYLFDVYRDPELNPTLAEFAAYLAFFPVTIAGPVCRLPDMLPQFRSEKRSSRSDIVQGFQRIAIGVLMMQIGNLLGQGILAGDGIASAFDRAQSWTGPDVWCLAFGYGLQLFFDFAGYSHTALGAAKALGISIPENFDRPFGSTTPSEFWTRWHMSLSFWIRDYVFLPFAVLRREIWWRHLALLFSMVIFGLWHRATLLFLLWGGFHGVLLISQRLLQQWSRASDGSHARLLNALSGPSTIALISLGWIFFRANSLSQAGQMFSALASIHSYSRHDLSFSLYALVAVLAAGYACVLLLIDIFERCARNEAANVNATSGLIPLLARWRWFWIPSLYILALLFLFIVTHGQEAGAGQLMYRRF